MFFFCEIRFYHFFMTTNLASYVEVFILILKSPYTLWLALYYYILIYSCKIELWIRLFCVLPQEFPCIYETKKNTQKSRLPESLGFGQYFLRRTKTSTLVGKTKSGPSTHAHMNTKAMCITFKNTHR